MYYLQLAKSLLHGEGFDTRLGFNAEGPNTQFFATWPVGYPILITVVAWITTLNVFWASKVLACLIGGGILLICYQLFGRTAWVYGLVLWFATFLELFSYSWSEVPFLMGLCVFVFALFEYDNNRNYSYLVLIGFTVIGLFLFRYIGGFVFFVLGLLIVKDWIRTRYVDWSLILACLLAGLVCCLYFYHNYLEVGYISGTTRPASNESFWVLSRQLGEATLKELSLAFTRKFSWLSIVITGILFQILLVILLKSYFSQKIFNRIDTIKPVSKIRIWPYYLLTGVCYLLTIILIRYNIKFDLFNFRLLAPGSFLIFFGVINWLERSRQPFPKIVGIFMLLVGGFSYLINGPLKIGHNEVIDEPHFPDYSHTIRKVEEKYAQIEKPSLIIFGNLHIIYKQLGVYVAKHKKMDGAVTFNKPLDSITNRLQFFKGDIYLESLYNKNKKQDLIRLHKEIKTIMEKNKNRELIKIK